MSYFKKVAGLEARKSINRKLQHRYFPVNIAKFLTTAFSIEQLWWLLLELRYFFSLWYRTLKFMKIVWRKHNLMIFFSVGSGHPGKIHMRFSMNTKKGEETSWWKLRVIAGLIWFLFSNSDFSSRICCHFFKTLCFGRIYFFTLFQITPSTQQLLIRGSYFFKTAAVFSFFRTVTLSQELFLSE